MPVLRVGPNSAFPSIAAAMLSAGPNDTIILEAGYANETATVTRGGLTIDGGAASTGIVLHLATGIANFTLTGAAPIAVVDASDANTIVGNAGDNLITVTDGADAVDGGLGVDRLFVDYRLATGAITGNSTSNVTEAGGSHSVTITDGTFEHFTILTGSGADTITTGAGDDIINVGEGANTVTAGQGANIITGGSGADTFTALDGGNRIDAGDGTNVVTSGAGADVIVTGSGSDTISAGGGDDLITLRGGSDIVHGEAGNDRLIIDYSRMTTSVTMNAPTGGLDGHTGQIADLSGDVASFDGVESFFVTGGAGGDLITTGQGSDTLVGGGGSDTLNGGGGVDTAVYGGLTRGYTTSVASASGTVAGGAEGGTDTLTSLEVIRFADGALSFDPNGYAAEVYRLYDTVLQRAPDSYGLNTLVHGLEAGAQTLAQVAASFVGSAEFQSHTGGLTTGQFIDYLYQTTLHRTADANGGGYWVDQIDSGAQTRAQVVLNFSESAEHQGNTAGAVNAGLYIYDEAYADAAYFYDAAFDRPGDAGGLTYWAGQLKAGLSLQGLADAFAASTEFQGDIAGKDHGQLVDYLYHTVLNCDADAGGRAYWTDQLDHGLTNGGILGQFALSNEHEISMQPALDHGVMYI